MHIQNIDTFYAQSALTLSLKSQRCARQIREKCINIFVCTGVAALFLVMVYLFHSNFFALQKFIMKNLLLKMQTICYDK